MYNYREPERFPLGLTALQKNVIYKAIVTEESDDSRMVYIGASELKWKKYSRTIKWALQKRYCNNTMLASHIWKIEDYRKVTNHE